MFVCVCVGGFFLIWPLFIVLPEVEVSGEAVVITSLIRGTSIREATPRLLRLLTRRVPGRHAVSAAKVSLSFCLHLSLPISVFNYLSISISFSRSEIPSEKWNGGAATPVSPSFISLVVFLGVSLSP